jgi:hypothetical protein
LQLLAFRMTRHGPLPVYTQMLLFASCSCQNGALTLILRHLYDDL